MCGIVGQWVSDLAIPANLESVRDRATKTRHRGPEEHGEWSNGRVAIVHQRLILRDPTFGAQPMIGTSGCVLAFNGEIYNCNGLRDELMARGREFKGDSDTEVVLAAYEEWGQDAWHRFNGMFAIVLFDQKSASLILVRDRLGLKPLFYKAQKNEVLFASEPAALSETHQLSEVGIAHYLTTARPVHKSLTLFDGVKSVPPGYQVSVTDQDLQSKRWTTTQNVSLVQEKSTSDLKAHIRFLVERSIGMQSDTGYPLGLFLSGGVDSAILLSVLRNQGRKFEAFTIALEDDHDDLDAALKLAASKQVRCHAVTLTAAEFFENMQALITIRNQPLAYTNDVLIYALSKYASKHAKVILSGEGADELFGGYSRLMSAAVAYQDATLSSFRSLKMNALRMQYPNARFDTVSAFIESLMSWWPWSALEGCLNNTYRAKLLDAIIEESDLFSGEANSDPMLLLLDNHLPNLLNRLDGATMAASVEGRVPFTDSELVKLIIEQRSANPLAPQWQDKVLLKEAFEDCLSVELRTKPKRPFDANLNIIFNSPSGHETIKAIRKSERLACYFNMERLNVLLDQNDQPCTMQYAWSLCNLNLWLNQNNL